MTYNREKDINIGIEIKELTKNPEPTAIDPGLDKKNQTAKIRNKMEIDKEKIIVKTPGTNKTVQIFTSEEELNKFLKPRKHIKYNIIREKI